VTGQEWGGDPWDDLPELSILLWGLILELRCKRCRKRFWSIRGWPEDRYMAHLPCHAAVPARVT
jgi:hypothetical protein